jgi:2,7-dihydroxy-5-methyl-1-naphthoate 7-O-methyltransferase
MSSPEAQLWPLLWGALATRALAVAVDEGVHEALADGPQAVAEPLARLLRALATAGVFAEGPPGTFRHTASSRLLLEPGWAELAHFHGGAWHRAAGELDTSGEAVFARAFGTDFWTWMAARPKERAAFDRAMEEGTVRRLDRLDSYAWRGDETVVDVGGGNGSLLLGLLARRPGLRGIVFDLPETAVRDLGERCRFVGGSFFDEVPAGDVHVLCTVLHDWDDERAAAILRTVRAAASADGVLLLVERAQPGGEWLDLLVLALYGARERDEPAWRSLLDSTGWSPEFTEHLIVCRPC